MIGKVLRGSNVRRLLYYLYGPGKANEHTNPHVVAGFADPADLEPQRRPNGAWDFRRLAGLLTQPLAALRGPGCEQPVWHCSLRAAPGDRELSDSEWAQVAAWVMDRTGLAAEGDELGVRWVAVRHAADHIHLVATLARQDGRRPRIWNDYYRVREACLAAERGFGLRRTASADRTAAKRPTRAETERAARRGWGEPPRVRLCREVCTAVAGAATEQEFFTGLQRAGVLVRRRYSTINPAQVTGYAVGLPGHTARNGAPVWYSGGKLAADLTLPKLRARWAGATDDGPLPGPGAPAMVVRAVLRNKVSAAMEQASGEAGFFAALRDSGVLVRLRFSETDPHQVTGYAVTLPGHTAAGGTPQWYGGGRLAAGLTLPRLRRRWAQAGNTGAERSGTPWFTVAEREEIYRHAARQAAVAAEHIRGCSATDPACAADAAWAAADTLHAAARAVRSPVLRRAADAYDRAARTAHGRIPRRTPHGCRLRAAARLVALAGQVAGEPSPGFAGLAVQLAVLTAEVAELRRAQQHAAQAAAARAAAEHLHTGLIRDRVRLHHRGTTRAPRPATATGGATISYDFPSPPTTRSPVPAAGSVTVARRAPHPGSLPPRRAGPAP